MSAERPIPNSEFYSQKLRIPKTWNKLARRLVIWLFNKTPLAPADIKNISNSLERASDLQNDGYCLWILGGPHFTKREGPEIDIRPPQFIPELIDRPFVSPVSFHQYIDHRRTIAFLSWLTATTITPVMNADAMEDHNRERIKRKLKREITLGDGVRPYARLVGEASRKGGFASIAPQAGRRTSLDLSQAEARTIEVLLTLNKIQRDSKIAFLFMSMNPMREVNYEKIKDSYNIGMRYKIVFTTLTLSELYGLLDRMNEQLAQRPIEKGKTQITLDELILIILSLPIGSDYNKIDPAYGNLLASIDYTGTMNDMMERGLFTPQVLE